MTKTKSELIALVEAIGTKIENKGKTAEGKLSAEEFNAVRELLLLVSSSSIDIATINTLLASKVNTSSLNTLLAGKVDKVTGKVLSTNDFTTYYKNAVDALISSSETAGVEFYAQ